MAGSMPPQAPRTPKAHKRTEPSVPNAQLPAHVILGISEEEFTMLRGGPPPRRAPPVPAKPKIRARLPQYTNIEHAVALLRASKNIMVLTGAGISTSLGIPDFRSGNGLYEALADVDDYDDPQQLFDLKTFHQKPRHFYHYVAPIIPKIPGVPTFDKQGKLQPASSITTKYSPTHAFLALLQSKGKLLTNYTQNIDNLELIAGLHRDKLVQCHGGWDSATCQTCGKEYPARKYLPVVYDGKLPLCKCSQTPAPKKRKSQKKRKRIEFEDSEEEEPELAEPERGLLKPDITFFGEGISNRFAPRLEADNAAVDLLLIIGTSLKVGPVNELPFDIPVHVPQIWINRDRCNCNGLRVDIELLGECDVIVQELCRRAGWPKSLDRHMWKPGDKVPSQGQQHTQNQLAVRSKVSGDGNKMISTADSTSTSIERGKTTGSLMARGRYHPGTLKQSATDNRGRSLPRPATSVKDVSTGDRERPTRPVSESPRKHAVYRPERTHGASCGPTVKPSALLLPDPIAARKDSKSTTSAGDDGAGDTKQAIPPTPVKTAAAREAVSKATDRLNGTPVPPVADNSVTPAKSVSNKLGPENSNALSTVRPVEVEAPVTTISTISVAKPGVPKVRTTSASSTPEKTVLVELEEGSDNRWYIKYSKEDPDGT